MKVEIRKNFERSSIDFFFYERRDGKTFYLRPTADGSLELTERKPGEAFVPSISIFNEIDDDFGLLKSLADALDGLGVKTDSDHKIQGTLEATKAHLADLRQLLKLK